MFQDRSFITAIWVAVIGFVGTSVVTLYQEWNESRNILRQEERRLQSELIITALAPEDMQVRLDNLEFLLEVGLIDAYEAEVERAVRGKVVPAQFILPSGRTIDVTGNNVSALRQQLKNLAQEERDSQTGGN